MNDLTAIAAVYSDQSTDIEGVLTEMLHAMRHRGNSVKIACLNDRLGVGIRSNDPIGGFFKSPSSASVLDGKFYGKVKRAPTRLARANSMRNIKSIMKTPGAFAVVLSRMNTLSAVREPTGLRPLYYSRKNGVTVIASERKALWRVGHIDADRVSPGYLYTVKPRKLIRRCLFRLPRPSAQIMTMDYAATRLKRLLQRSTRLITADVRRVAVAFSGGLDSAITALLAKQANLEVELLSSGLRGSNELQTVGEYAKALNLPIFIETHEADSLDHFVSRIIWTIEEANLMKVSIAIPLYWTAMLAARRGHSVMLCGQGSDELYGGYYKYAKILDHEGKRALASALYRGVIESPQVNYERDEQATCPSGVELRTPFANLDVIDFSLRIPLEFKVRTGNDLMRKWVLRAAALKAGLPEEIVWRRKKAIQHGTGVENAIRKLARKQGLSTDGYLTNVSIAISRQEEMPSL